MKKAERKQSLSVVVPVRDEEEIIARNAEALTAFLDENVGDYEVLLCEGGSADRTREIAERIAGKQKRVKALESPNASMPGAIRFGFEHACKQAILFYPIDLSHSLDFITRALALLKEYEVVVGSRKLGGQERSFLRTSLNWLNTASMNALFETSFSDVGSLKMFRAPAGKRVVSATRTNSSVFEVETLALVRNSGLKWTEIPVTHVEHRLHGEHAVEKAVKHAFDLAREFRRLKRERV